MTIDLRLGDCAAILPEYADNSMDAIVTDPPYGLSDHDTDDVMACLAAWLAGEPYTNGHRGFMGATWDSWVPGPEIWRECYRVLKPGGYLLCFAGSRTADLMSIALRLAGFRKHSEVYWVYGQGFPKATNLGKQFDKEAGALETQSVGFNVAGKTSGLGTIQRPELRSDNPNYSSYAPATPEAQRWDGWYYGLQALKPAAEPVLMFQKPPDRRMTENVLTWGTGAINVDATRVGMSAEDADFIKKTARPNSNGSDFVGSVMNLPGARTVNVNPAGRWPSHLITDGSAEVRACFPVTKAGVAVKRNLDGRTYNAHQEWGLRAKAGEDMGYDDTGSASRFFHAAPFEQEDFEAAEAVAEQQNARAEQGDKPRGRWPSHLITDGSEEVRACFPTARSSGVYNAQDHGVNPDQWVTNFAGKGTPATMYGDTGSAARFFHAAPFEAEDFEATRLYYCAKASKRDRDEGCEDIAEIDIELSGRHTMSGGPLAVNATAKDGTAKTQPRHNGHPTVKPVNLCKYLCRLICQPGGVVLDPFMGSGSVGKGAVLEGFSFVGIELDADYMEIARRRIAHAQEQMRLTTTTEQPTLVVMSSVVESST